MGNFEKLSVLVIVVIIVMILVVALYTWTGDPESTAIAKDPTVAAMSDAARTGASNRAAEIVIPKPALAGADRTAPAPGMVDPITGLPMGSLAPSPFPTPVITPPVADLPKEPVKPAEPRFHEVASGDNLTKIAKKYYGSKTTTGISLIRTANALSDESMLRVGQKLTIPELRDDGKVAVVAGGKGAPVHASEAVPSLKPGSVYTVRSGDTLPRISKRAYGTADKWHEIWLANFNVIDDPEKVSPGTRLKLPM
jgi:nucleoid-associated protein YgaU